MRPLALAVTAAILFTLSLPARGQLLSRTPPPDTVRYQMKDGSFLAFRQVNLSMGEIGFEILVSSNIKSKNGPKLEFRIDRPKGKKIGSLKIPDTADTTFTLKLTGQLRNAFGVHDLFLVAKGEGEFQISGFGFIHNYFAER
ncbi:carbohydrate-binding protein [Chitinophaga sp. YIM B06452]|uniref:carbohydrate-binding protein n=1 Tax=Chitinophaga sp. YIM B06452 TaxID=3082158 RepID=UPI0031FEFA1E